MRQMQALVPDQLWTDHAPLSIAGLQIGRRVTVARGETGLVVFSPVAGTEQNIAALRALGPIAAFVVQNRVHDLYYEQYFEPFRGVPFIAPAGVIDNHRSWPLTPLSSHLPALAGFRWLELRGMPQAQEHVFLHPATRTLIVADALFNLPPTQSLFPRLMRIVGGMNHPPGPTRLFRSLIKDRAAFAASLREILTWDFDRIAVGHGQVIETAGRQAWARAFSQYLSGSE